MIIRTGQDGFIHPHSSEITPRTAYLQRRQWLLAAAAAGAGDRDALVLETLLAFP